MLLTKTGFHPAFAWLIFITAFLLLPGDDLPKEDWLDAIYADKLVHIMFFAVLVYLFYRPLRHKPKNWLPLIALAAFAYGISIEFIQERWAINRNFDGLDIVADGIGCIVGFIYSIKRKQSSYRKRRRKSREKK
jgi:VanZ family protein